MTQKTKIAFVIPSLGAGGMERVMSEVVGFIASKEGVECHLVLYGKTREQFYQVPDNVIIHIPNFPYIEARRQWITLKTMWFIRKTIKGIAPISLLSFGEIWNNLVLLSLIGIKVPIYLSDRSSPEKRFGLKQRYLRRWLYPRAAGLVAQTTQAKEVFQYLELNRNIKVIGNPIREIEQDNRFEREKIAVSVGRLIETKHFDRLTTIFSRINVPGWKLIIVGGDSNKQENSQKLQAQIDDLNLPEGTIELVGQQKDIEKYLLQSAIFAFTSSSEGFPNVVGEAMAAGLPVVSYDCVAGPSDMIEDGDNGFLIPLFEDKVFEEKLRYLMENGEERVRMGRNAVESIKMFSVEKIGEQFYNFIKNQSDEK